MEFVEFLFLVVYLLRHIQGYIRNNHGEYTLPTKDFKSNTPYRTVDFVPGRMIAYPALYAHRAGQPTPGTTRVCHNARIQIRSHINDQILSNTPDLSEQFNLNTGHCK